MPSHFHSRIHESVALAALLAASVELNAFWIVNMISMRLPAFADLLKLDPSLGTVSGLYVTGAVVYLLSWACFLTLLRGRDCSEYRSNALWLFVVSVLLYLVFTFPPIFNFVIVTRG